MSCWITNPANPVRSAVLLLRPEADGPELSGIWERRLPGGDRYLEFRYDVVRAWQKPVGPILAGGLWGLPLAPIADVTPGDLPDVLRRIRERVAAEATPEEGAKLWATTYILMGLRYPEELTSRLLQGVRSMKDSVTYQAILREGRAEGLARGQAEGLARGERRLLMKLGRERFGEPDPRTIEVIESLTGLEQIEEVAGRLLTASCWAELVART